MSRVRYTIYSGVTFVGERPMPGVNYELPEHTYQCPDADVYVCWQRHAPRNHAATAHAAMVALQADGIRVGELVDIHYRKPKPRAPKHVREAAKHTKKLL